jgi:hypothetical protein
MNKSLLPYSSYATPPVIHHAAASAAILLSQNNLLSQNKNSTDYITIIIFYLKKLKKIKTEISSVMSILPSFFIFGTAIDNVFRT